MSTFAFDQSYKCKYHQATLTNWLTTFENYNSIFHEMNQFFEIYFILNKVPLTIFAKILSFI